MAEIIRSKFFRPFTLDEVKTITGISSNLLDTWSKRLGIEQGEGDQSEIKGLGFMRTFACYVGWKFVGENAGEERAWLYVKFIGACSEEYLRNQCSVGNNWPLPPDMIAKSEDRLLAAEYPNGTFVPAPRGLAGAKLNLTKLAREFGARLDATFKGRN